MDTPQDAKRRHATPAPTLNGFGSTARSLGLMQVLLCAGCVILFACNAMPSTEAKHLSFGSEGGIDDFEHHRQIHAHGSASHHHQQQQQQRRRLQRDSRAKEASTAAGVQEQCDGVKGYFKSIDIELSGNYIEKGGICGGNCCGNATETELRQKATGDFERLLHHHTKSLRGILESTATLFQNHVLELAEQSENRTMNVFSQVYRRMVPLSRQLIHQLYSEIMSHLKYTSNYSNNINGNTNPSNANANLEAAIHKFFENLFPVAYHQAVHLSKDNYGELHEDYVNCLKHNFDDLMPFGTIPKEIKTNLLQSVHTANIFMNALLQSAEVLSDTDELYGAYLTDTCKRQLLKMYYCPTCNGHQRGQVKVCYSYCMNVMRGCSAQYAGLLDSPWSNVVDALDNLVTQHIHADSGIVTTIKQLDVKLSETIMRAMENGPELEKKVTKTCGTPKLLPSVDADTEPRSMAQHNIKWATPPDAEILRFLSTIDRSKDFYANIVNNVCEDEDVQKTDHHCWTGERVSDYSQLLMTTGADIQRYNPEVPLEVNAQTTKLNELMDKLIKIRKSLGVAAPTTARLYSDIQADMGHQEEEGSGRIVDDDEEYGNMHGSGDGSGDDATRSDLEEATDRTSVTSNEIEKTSKASSISAGLSLTLSALLTLVTILLSSSSGSGSSSSRRSS